MNAYLSMKNVESKADFVVVFCYETVVISIIITAQIMPNVLA